MNRLIRFLRLLDQRVRLYRNDIDHIFVFIIAVLLMPVLYALCILWYSSETDNVHIIQGASLITAIAAGAPVAFLVMATVEVAKLVMQFVRVLVNLWRESAVKEKRG